MRFPTLMFAAHEGHTATLQALLKAGAKVDQPRTDGMTALMWAANNGHSATLQALLQGGADWKLKSKSGATALDIAIRKKTRTLSNTSVHTAPPASP